jgi:hypothetical protein
MPGRQLTDRRAQAHGTGSVASPHPLHARHRAAVGVQALGHADDAGTTSDHAPTHQRHQHLDDHAEGVAQ